MYVCKGVFMRYGDVCVYACVCACSQVTLTLTSDVGAAQQLHSEGDALVPGVGDDAQEARYNGRVERVPGRVEAVHIPLEHLGTARVQRVNGLDPTALQTNIHTSNNVLFPYQHYGWYHFI